MAARSANKDEGHENAEDNKEETKRLPKIFMLVTGKGPLKQKYMTEILSMEKEEDWRWVRCRSLWLEAEDYPLVLGESFETIK